jgi:NitT/TauT family transport system ATP-binding protein
MTATTTPAIEVTDIGKTFVVADKSRHSLVEALAGVSFSVQPGEFLSILGPSGSGRTTCLRILSGLLDYDYGSVQLNGKPVTGPSTECGIVFQQFNLLPWKTVAENIEFGLKVQGVGTKQERRDRAMEYLNLVGLAGFERHYPHQLSGGMQQRVGIARALATEPSVLLMDEPFASVDAQTREVLQGELLRILDRTETSVVFITHSIDEAIYLSNRVIIFSVRPSRVIASFEVDLASPRWEYDVHVHPRFAELRHEAWTVLKSAGTDPKDLPPADAGK